MSFVVEEDLGASYSSRRSVRNRPKFQEGAAQRKFLPEVQGLRAVAVLMVVTYHVRFGRISGGVDVSY